MSAAKGRNAMDSLIGPATRIEGDLRFCGGLRIDGNVRGNVYVAELLEIEPKARIIGEVCYKVLEMHGGAQVLGKLAHHEGSGAERLLPISGA
jgi:cytoskeletal protein CcmA (bactofilin family)